MFIKRWVQVYFTFQDFQENIEDNKRVEKSKVKNESSTVHIFTRQINNTRTNTYIIKLF